MMRRLRVASSSDFDNVRRLDRMAKRIFHPPETGGWSAMKNFCHEPRRALMSMARRFLALAITILIFLARPAAASLISVGAFPATPSPDITIPLGTFLVPVEVQGAVGLSSWQFDLLFNPAVVQEVDPLDGSSGIYGAAFN